MDTEDFLKKTLAEARARGGHDESLLIAWLKQWFVSGNILLHLVKNYDPEALAELALTPSGDDERSHQIILDIRFVYSSYLSECWVLNAGDRKGQDLLVRVDRKGLYRKEYGLELTFRVQAPREDNGRWVRHFEAEEIPGPGVGAGYEGKIVFDPAGQTFSFKDVGRTWIA